jgi:hypothetical protein
MALALPKGTQLERRLVASLQAAGCNVAARGGAGDEGLDFHGWWRLPGRAAGTFVDVPVVGQVKHFARPVGPAPVRELEGAVERWRRGLNAAEAARWRSAPLTVLACADHGFSQAALR